MYKFILFFTFNVFLLSLSLQVRSQDKQLDFSAKWKASSEKAIIVVSAFNATLPYTVYVYDNTPFLGGKLIIKKEGNTSNFVEIEIQNKQKVCVCLYIDEAHSVCKWVDVLNK